MKLFKLILPAAVAAFIVGTTPFAQAQVADGTYVFRSDGDYFTWDPNANNGAGGVVDTGILNTSLDGSSVTFSGGAITSWDLVDSNPNSAYATWMPANVAPYLAPLTPANSSLFDVTIYSPTRYGSSAFSFQVGSPVGADSTSDSIFWFSADNDLFGPGDSGDLYDGFGPNAFDYPFAQDPAGVWAVQAAVPNASGTFQLLLGALTAIGACKLFFRCRVASRR